MNNRTRRLHNDLPKARTAPEKTAIERQMAATDRRIDQLERHLRDAHLVGYEEFRNKKKSGAPDSSGIYAGWEGERRRLLYVGKTTALRSRIRSHFSGDRGGDQFCLYVGDKFIYPELCRSKEVLKTLQINCRTRRWIRTRVRFGWVKLAQRMTSDAERCLRRRWRPILNSPEDQSEGVSRG